MKKRLFIFTMLMTLTFCVTGCSELIESMKMDGMETSSVEMAEDSESEEIYEEEMYAEDEENKSVSPVRKVKDVFVEPIVGNWEYADIYVKTQDGDWTKMDEESKKRFGDWFPKEMKFSAIKEGRFEFVAREEDDEDEEVYKGDWIKEASTHLEREFNYSIVIDGDLFEMFFLENDDRLYFEYEEDAISLVMKRIE